MQLISSGPSWRDANNRKQGKPTLAEDCPESTEDVIPHCPLPKVKTTSPRLIVNWPSCNAKPKLFEQHHQADVLVGLLDAHIQLT
jgi:hypothetical protein